mmetsp:Transcript_29000/g.43814  ORF Transcript_29000/g.43814 Transcript_29000/m.43814 type:complete len:588 (-) Transcript_29000:155-1918(-)
MAPSKELPKSYKEAMDALLKLQSSMPLASLDDSAMVKLADDMLSNFYACDWKTAGDWTEHEGRLYQLEEDSANFQSNVSMARYQLTSILTGYLGTFKENLKYKMASDDKSKKTPELLSKKRAEGDHTVYGPVSVPGIPFQSFEVWTGKGDEEKSDEPVPSDDAPIAVVLGAGNQSILTLMDTIHNVFHNRRPVLVKHHPLRPWLLELYTLLFKPLGNYVTQVLDVDLGATQALVLSPAVGHVHLTGAYQTSKAIRELLDKNNRKDVTMTSELGSASPMIFQDEEFSEIELKHAAQTIVFGKKTNGGCNCLSAQVVIMSKDWSQKDLFRTKLKEELKRQPTMPCYYPKSLERKKQMMGECPSDKMELIPSTTSQSKHVKEEDHVTLIECGTPGTKEYISLPVTTEAFNPTLCMVELESASDGADFLETVAVPFLNNKENIFGSLSCSIFSSKNTVSKKTLNDLMFGTIAVNSWNGMGYMTTTCGGSWGGHPMETRYESGQGCIGNIYNLPNLTKIVVYGPSLTSKPAFDLAAPPPPVIMDALTYLFSTQSILVGMTKVVGMLWYRSAMGLLSLAVPKKWITSFALFKA